MKVLVCWSGGKNSTRSVIEYLKLGYLVVAVCYIPYFDDEIPLIDHEHWLFIQDTADYFRSLGVEVVFLRGISYYDWCSVKIVRGKYKGFERGTPLFIRGKCGFARDGKIAAINSFFEQRSEEFDIVDIGLCADEYDRKILKGKEVSILQKLGISDLDCFYWCRDRGLLSPKYRFSKRDGCVLCPHAKRFERYRFFERYPQAVPKVLELQSFDKKLGYYSLRGKHFFIENEDFVCGYGSQLDCLSTEVYY